MKRTNLRIVGVYGPEQLKDVVSVYDDTAAAVFTKDGPYAHMDPELLLNLTAKAVLEIASTRDLSREQLEAGSLKKLSDVMSGATSATALS